MSRKKASVFFILAFLFAGFSCIVSVGLAHILTGIWVLCFGLWLSRKNSFIEKNGISVKGYIVDNEKDGEGDLKAIYEFVTDSGETIIGKEMTAGSGGDIGKEVILLYDPRHPGDFTVERSPSTSKIKIIISVLFVVIILFLFTMGYLILAGFIPGER